MANIHTEIAYVRRHEAPALPPPAGSIGLWSRLRSDYFSSIGDAIVTCILGTLILWVLWNLFAFTLLNAFWIGTDRSACTAPEGGGMGACWPFVQEKIGQWIYGFFPIEQRWRIDLCFLFFFSGLVPLLIPSVPHKGLNIIYMLAIFPIVAFVLLTGGNYSFSPRIYLDAVILVSLALATLPFLVFGIFEGLQRNRWGFGLAGAALFLWLIAVTGVIGPSVYGIPVDVLTLAVLGAVLSVFQVLRGGDQARRVAMIGLILAFGGLIAIGFLDFDFGLAPVATTQWGGLSLTLIVAVTGISTSMPVGVLLALGRRSNLPLIKVLCVTFIEVVRAVPLITVLFMASVMLPLFLPPGTSVDKLLRALVGVALFSSAYMAEVVRGGLQAIPKGQYEGAMALGMSGWQSTTRIILPQALKIVIPNIVSTFIALFKDTTLVLIVGLFDLLGLAQTGLRDPNWSSASTAATGYLFIAAIYWLFCFSMSRYAMFTERRLQTGHRRS